jgi:hypothetical protein
MERIWAEEIRRKSLDTLKRQLRGRIGGYVKDVQFAKAENSFFRGVAWNERPKTVKGLSYPPAEKITELGRLNREHQPMFYASCGAPAVYYEIHVKAGDRVALSRWDLIEPAWMHNLGFHPEALKRIGGILWGGRERFANPIRNESKFNERLRRRLSRYFTEDVPDDEAWRYKLPIAINELLFDGAAPCPIDHPGGPRFERAIGTVYPAMGMRGAADNVAIWPEYADRFLRLVNANYVLVEAVDSARLSYTILSLAQATEFRDGEIMWRPGIEGERHKRGTVAYENGRWVLRDGLGEIYAVH